VGRARRARLALHLLQNHGRRLGHHLLQDLAHRLVVGLELGDEQRQDAEVSLLRIGLDGREPLGHRTHESLVHRVDLGLQVVDAVHQPTIWTASRSFNAIVALLFAAGAALAVDVPGTDGRVRVDGTVDGLAVVGTATGPRQRPEGRVSLDTEARITRRLRLVTEVRGRIGGPFEGGPGAGVYDFRRAYQNRSPALELRQAAIEHRGRHFDAAVGVQTFAWGKLDGLPPTDVLNPRDYHYPIVRDVEDRKIGVPAVALTYYPTAPRSWRMRGLRATVVWIPWAVPSRMAEIRERWFPASTAVPSRISVRGTGGSLAVPARLRTQSEPPPRSLRAGGLGLRLGGTLRGVDWDVYHYSGPETGPNVDLLADAVLRPRLRAEARLSQAHDVIYMTGADVAFVLGPVALRGEAAHFVDRPMLRSASDLLDELSEAQIDRVVARVVRRGRARVPVGELFPDQDVLEWGIGADGVWRGWNPLVQLSQVIVLDSAPPLLVANPETRGLVRLSRRWFADRLTTELRFLWAIERGSWFAQPGVSYLVRDDLRLGVQYLAIGGKRRSLIGQFRGNDGVIFESRWSF